MPRIAPFKAYRYNPKRFTSLKKLVSPPYDVISPAEQKKLYGKSAYNFVRMDFRMKNRNGDTYTEVRRELDAWIRQGVFVPERKESLYVYVQDYRNLYGKKVRRVGFIGLLGLDEMIQRHERTLHGPKEDRTALLTSVRANLSPLFAFFEDRSGLVQRSLLASARRKPAVDVRLNGIRHRLYPDNNKKRLDLIRRTLGKKAAFIADGHHRYEVSRKFYLGQHPSARRGASERYVMTYLCDAHRNDMTLYPTHRVLSLKKGWKDLFDRLVRRYFRVERCRTLEDLLTRIKSNTSRTPALGVFCLSGVSGSRNSTFSGYLYLSPKRGRGEPDTVLAEKRLIQPLLGGESVGHTRRIRYTRNASDAVRWVEDHESSVALLLPGMSVEDVIRISRAGKFLPQKSTFFYPKLLSGLVFYKFQEDRNAPIAPGR